MCDTARGKRNLAKGATGGRGRDSSLRVLRHEDAHPLQREGEERTFLNSPDYARDEC